ncbi:MAG: pyruvate dehydrogenase (acetyl-transferring) E1 component subunit alpha [Candidatus Methylomirabilia bacterium]
MPRQTIDLPDSVELLSILDAEGRVDRALDPGIPDGDLRRLYRTMLMGRRFDERMLRLQRQGRIGTFGPIAGHEAISLGSVYALRSTDWIVPYYREWPALWLIGWAPEEFILFYAGYQEGMRVPDGVRALPMCIPIASQIPHAVGMAYAARYKGDDSVVLSFFGDGATSHGDFHEAMNFAGVWQAPVIFCCQNNRYAISTPVSKQTRSKTLAQKAIAYGFPGIQVDGNDILAVYVATREAVERARAGRGPTLIECLTYRLGAHTTADDPTKYRSEEEVKAWEKKDPLIRFRKYLEDKGLLDESAHAALEAEIAEEIRSAVERAEARMDADPLKTFAHVYAELPAELQEQREELTRYLADTEGRRER